MGGDDDEDGCVVDVWQDLFRVDSRMWSVERIRSCADSQPCAGRKFRSGFVSGPGSINYHRSLAFYCTMLLFRKFTNLIA